MRWVDWNSKNTVLLCLKNEEVRRQHSSVAEEQGQKCICSALGSLEYLRITSKLTRKWDCFQNILM